MRPLRLFVTTLLALPLAVPLEAATITVTASIDVDLDDAECTLREAIVAANDDAVYHGCPAGAGPDRILFGFATPATIALGAPLPPIESPLLLRGPGADLLDLDGQDLWTILDASTNTPDVWLGLEDLTLRRGAGAAGGALLAGQGTHAELRRVRLLDNQTTVGGGAVWVSGTAGVPASATFIECELAGNGTAGASGGGAIRVIGPGASVRLERSTLSDNLAEGFNGGAVAVQNGDLELDRSTLSGNAADGSGGGIHLNGSGGDVALEVTDSTLAFNTANLDANASGDGGGVSVIMSAGFEASLAFRNSIVAANVDGGGTLVPDLYLAASGSIDWASAGFNLIGSNAGATAHVGSGSPNVGGDYVGTAASPIDPRLDGLDSNGAAVASHRPQLAPTVSPAVDAGACPAAAGDQRGFGDAAAGTRRLDLGTVANGFSSDGCDIGSHERNGIAGADASLFANGFEEGHTLPWSSEQL